MKEEHCRVQEVARLYYPSCEVLLLHKETNAIKINDFIIGSASSKFFGSSILLVESKELRIESLCEIEHFLQVTVALDSHKHDVLWLAVASLYTET